MSQKYLKVRYKYFYLVLRPFETNLNQKNPWCSIILFEMTEFCLLGKKFLQDKTSFENLHRMEKYGKGLAHINMTKLFSYDKNY